MPSITKNDDNYKSSAYVELEIVNEANVLSIGLKSDRDVIMYEASGKILSKSECIDSQKPFKNGDI